jgi:RNA polymerase sigma-70 factor (ECF subfamily)
MEAKVANHIGQNLSYLERMVRGLMGNDPMTDDIVQETMLKALVHAERFRFESSLKTWLTSTAMNEVRSFYRCKWTTRSVPLIAERLESNRSLEVDFVSTGYQATERDALIRRAVSRLPEPYRSVVELCDWQCVPLREAAAQLRLTLEAAKTLRRRARKKLRPFLAKVKTLNDFLLRAHLQSPQNANGRFLTQRESEYPNPQPSHSLASLEARCLT